MFIRLAASKVLRPEKAIRLALYQMLADSRSYNRTFSPE
jgi:hypothetical protein